MTTPGGFITIAKGSSRAVRIGVIPNGKDGAGDIIEQLCRPFILYTAAIRDITRADEYNPTR